MMETVGILKGAARDLVSGNWIISFETQTLPILGDLTGGNALDITAKRHRAKRSKNANALLWECIGRMAKALCADKWDIYLQMLKRYGEFTYVCVKPGAVEMLKKQWRECEEIGPIMVNGTAAVQLLCYYGSSTYNTKQFSTLLDGVISEMREMGLDVPGDEHLKAALEQWEKYETKNSV
jgi:hypothetical protein